MKMKKIIIIRDVKQSELKYAGLATTIKCSDVLLIVKINHKTNFKKIDYTTVTANKNNTWFAIPNDCYVLDDYIDKSYRSNCPY